MKIGILGAGNMGGTLGRLWAEGGHEVFFGLRDCNSVKAQRAHAAICAKARWGTAAEAADFAEVVLIAVPWSAAEEVVKPLAARLAGKVLIDCINPIKADLCDLAIGHTDSAAETIARWAPQAHVVKAFNTVGAGGLHDAKYGDHSASIFICGDDEQAKEMVAALADTLGFEAIDAGPLVEARYLEPLAMLWIHLAMRGKFGGKLAVKLLRR